MTLIDTQLGELPLELEGDGHRQLCAQAERIVLPISAIRLPEPRSTGPLVISDLCLALTDGLSAYGD